MKGVLLTDCKKGDLIVFRLDRKDHHFGDKPHNGRIKSINKSRKTLLVTFRAKIDGVVKVCGTYVRPEEVLGFYV